MIWSAFFEVDAVGTEVLKSHLSSISKRQKALQRLQFLVEDTEVQLRDFFRAYLECHMLPLQEQ